MASDPVLFAKPLRALNSGKDKPSIEEVEEAVRTLIRWGGDDPDREGLLDTPNRVAKAYNEFFAGYDVDPHDLLNRTFSETDGYQDIVLLRDVKFDSHCEHHLVPILGTAHVAYLPGKRVVGISKLARVVDAYARRMQIQERLTAQIGDTIEEVIKPRGVAVLVESSHQCMTTRGIHKEDAQMVTTHMLGDFQTDRDLRTEFFRMIGK
ncbi:MAG: GTP cyclohydrolase I FolE [Pseudomonadota bacterium]